MATYRVQLSWLMVAVLATVLLCSELRAATLIEGTAIDVRGNELSDMRVRLAVNFVGSTVVFDNDSYSTRTDGNGNFSVTLDDDSFGVASIHLIAYSEKRFGEVFNTSYMLTKGSTSRFYVLCGPRRTVRVRASDPEELVTRERGPCMIILRGPTGPRVHYIEDSELGRVHEFPVGKGQFKVQYLYDRAREGDSLGSGGFPTAGWRARGEVTDAELRADVVVPLNVFGDGGDIVRLRFPLEYSWTYVYAVTDQGDIVWSEGVGGYYRAHVGDARVRENEEGDKFYHVPVALAGESVKLLLYDFDSGMSAEVDVDKLNGAEADVEFRAVPESHHLEVHIPKEADVWPGHEVLFRLEKGALMSVRSAVADADRKLRIPMPGRIEGVKFRMFLKTTASVTDAGLEGIASCGEPLKLEWKETHKVLLVLGGPDRQSLGPQTFYVEREEPDGDWSVVGRTDASSERETRKMMILQVDREYRLRIGAIAMPPLSIRPGTSELHVTAWGYDEERDGGSSDDG